MIATGTLTLLAIFGSIGQLLAMILLVYLSLASSGGTVPIQALPGFFQIVGHVEPLRNTLLGTRAILYFGARGALVRPQGALPSLPGPGRLDQPHGRPGRRRSNRQDRGRLWRRRHAAQQQSSMTWRLAVTASSRVRGVVPCAQGELQAPAWASAAALRGIEAVAAPCVCPNVFQWINAVGAKPPIGNRAVL
jgi:hypothetical protein